MSFGRQTGAKGRHNPVYFLREDRQAWAGLGLTRFNNWRGLWSTQAILSCLGEWALGFRGEVHNLSC